MPLPKNKLEYGNKIATNLTKVKDLNSFRTFNTALCVNLDRDYEGEKINTQNLPKTSEEVAQCLKVANNETVNTNVNRVSKTGSVLKTLSESSQDLKKELERLRNLIPNQ